MEQVDFKIQASNPLTQLCELRFEVSAANIDFELVSRLVFGKMLYQHKDREYHIGVSRAFLRIFFEGCETKLGYVFGENTLEPVKEEDEIESQITAGLESSISSSSQLKLEAGVSAKVNAGETRTSKKSQLRSNFPIVSRPNDCWEIRPLSVNGNSGEMIEGTAIPGVRLCDLRRKKSVNRIALVGEIHVSKSDFKVSSQGGNAAYKKFSEYTNKDAIVSQILKLAIQREAASSEASRAVPTVVISRCEVQEE